MEPLKLEDLVPVDATFKLKQFADREFRIKKFDLADEIWMKQTFKGGLTTAFLNADMDTISRILYHQLSPQDKAVFKRQSVAVAGPDGKPVPQYDEDGNEVTEQMVGGVKLLQMCIVGQSEQHTIISALLEAIGMSRPVQEKYSDSDKKKEVTSPNPKSTGGKSSTSSVPSTDGASDVALP